MGELSARRRRRRRRRRRHLEIHVDIQAGELYLVFFHMVWDLRWKFFVLQDQGSTQNFDTSLCTVA